MKTRTATADPVAPEWPLSLGDAYTYDALVGDSEPIDMHGIARLLGVTYGAVVSWRPNYKGRKIKIDPADGPHPQLLPPELEDMKNLTWRRGDIMRWAMHIGRWNFELRRSEKIKPPGRPPKAA